jgi:AcrR family transcriptional regulator
VSDVARDVGVTPAAVYAYFPSKEALFAAAVDADAEELVNVAANVLVDFLDSGTLPDVVIELANAVLGAMDRHPLAGRVLAGHESIGAERILDLPSLVRLRETLAVGIEYGQGQGQVRTDVDPKTMALGLESIVLNQLAASVQDGYSHERWQAVVAVMEAAMKPPVAAG